MNFKRIALWIVVVCQVSSAAAAEALAQSAHSGAFPASGNSDIQARVIADELSKALGQPVISKTGPAPAATSPRLKAARSTPEAIPCK
jgi:tripartite-type tricarboxylate transporter receptor subunit TctC